MSVDVFWQPQGKGSRLVGAKSSFVEQFRRIFGEPPKVMNVFDIPRLEVLAKLEDLSMRGPWSNLLDAVHEFSEVRIWTEY